MRIPDRGRMEQARAYLAIRQQEDALPPPVRASFRRDDSGQIDAAPIRRFLDRLEELSILVAQYDRRQQRPEIDHCPVDAASIARRIRKMMAVGDFGGRLICIGDNDRIAPVAAASGLFEEIAIVDRDEHVLATSAELNSQIGGVEIKMTKLDVRDARDVDSFLATRERFYTLATCDPPYTTAGYIGFTRLAIRALQLNGALHLIVPFMHFEPWSSDLVRDVEEYVVQNGMLITDIWRSAQTFQVGSGVVSSQLRLERLALASEEHTIHHGSFYTMEELWD